MAFDDWSDSPEPAPERHAPPDRAPSPEVEPLPWPPPDAPVARVGRSALAAAPAAPRPAPSPTAARAKAGLGLIAAAAAVGLGGVLAGPTGALAGVTAVGAARNLYRSQGIASSDPTEQSDAARSLAIGVVGVAILGYLGYRIWAAKEGD